jgi:hypothetical protein
VGVAPIRSLLPQFLPTGRRSMASQDASTQLPTGSLHAAPSKSGPGFYWEGHWRYEGRQVKRRLGRAHLVLRDVPDESRKGWQRTHEKPKGAPGVGILSERKAWGKLSEVIAAHAEDVAARALEADERAEPCRRSRQPLRGGSRRAGRRRTRSARPSMIGPQCCRGGRSGPQARALTTAGDTFRRKVAAGGTCRRCSTPL